MEQRAVAVDMRSRVWAGFVAAAVMSAWFLIVRLPFGIPTPSEMIIDASGPLIPVHLFGLLISLVHGYVELKIIGFTSVIIGQLLVGIVACIVAAQTVDQRRTLAIISAALFVATIALLWTVLQTNYRGVPPNVARIETLASLAIGYLLFFAIGSRLLQRTQSTRSDRGRSRFLTGAIAAVAAVGGIGGWAALFARSTFGYDGTSYRGPDVERLTPAGRFYVVTKNVTDPNVNLHRWELTVRGPLVEETIGFERLAAMPYVDQETTLMCINNAVDGGLMSNALWRGVPLRDLVGNVDPSIKRVALHAADNYIDTIPIAKALDPTTIVAYRMNGESLPDRHGFPVRAIVPGLFGEKNVKWLTGITLETIELKGFYERQGWGPLFAIPTHARFDAPDFAQPLPHGPVDVRGVAFAGDRGISRVEVSTDAGTTWSEAMLLTPYNRLTWRLWSYRWQPPRAGRYQLIVRATDADGRVQTAERRGAETQGVTGRDMVTADVT